MNDIVARTLKLGYNLFDTLHACSVLPVQHYNLHVGLLQPGDPADFIVVDSPERMNVLQTWIDGNRVFHNGTVLFPEVDSTVINRFEPYQLEPKDFKLYSEKTEQQIIVAEDGQLITKRETATLRADHGEILADPDRDILKIAVVNRYQEQPPAVGFIKNFGLKNGAIASSVAHDSHNIVAVGSSDEAICQAVNLVMESRGGISAVHGDQTDVLPLPVGGIMSNDSGEIVARGYERLSNMSRDMGSTLKAPFMLISFMALLVIPSLKMSDKGLFDGEEFVFVEQ
jgi:adenine deaminase